MNTPLAISGSLVNMRNVGTHKSVALTVHVPEELAQNVIAAFGWPTAAAPVPVALARLNDAGSSNGRTSDFESDDAGSTPAPATKGKRNWEALEPAQQAGIRCNEPAFDRFLRETHNWTQCTEVADMVRQLCHVASRADLNTNHAARVIWHQLDQEFQTWMREPAL